MNVGGPVAVLLGCSLRGPLSVDWESNMLSMPGFYIRTITVKGGMRKYKGPLHFLFRILSDTSWGKCGSRLKVPGEKLAVRPLPTYIPNSQWN